VLRLIQRALVDAGTPSFRSRVTALDRSLPLRSKLAQESEELRTVRTGLAVGYRDSALTGRDTVESSDTSHGTREMPGDSVERRTLKVSGDSARLEDTLSAPRPSADSVPSQR
jgi:hypothetical protein